VSDGERREHVFVVRAWCEPAPVPQWRATVEDLSTGQRLATTDLRDVDDFIRLRIRAADPPHRG
jgi:hypothetical protein